MFRMLMLSKSSLMRSVIGRCSFPTQVKGLQNQNKLVVCFSNSNKSPENVKNVDGDTTKVKVPQMGESITTGTLGKWLKKIRDYVKADEIVTTIDTDKVNVDVRSPKEGVITKQFVQEGTDVTIDQDLFELSTSGDVATKTDKAATTSGAQVSRDDYNLSEKPNRPPAAVDLEKTKVAKPRATKKFHKKNVDEQTTSRYHVDDSSSAEWSQAPTGIATGGTVAPSQSPPRNDSTVKEQDPYTSDEIDEADDIETAKQVIEEVVNKTPQTVYPKEFNPLGDAVNRLESLVHNDLSHKKVIGGSDYTMPYDLPLRRDVSREGEDKRSGAAAKSKQRVAIESLARGRIEDLADTTEDEYEICGVAFGKEGQSDIVNAESERMNRGDDMTQFAAKVHSLSDPKQRQIKGHTALDIEPSENNSDVASHMVTASMPADGAISPAPSVVPLSYSTQQVPESGFKPHTKRLLEPLENEDEVIMSPADTTKSSVSALKESEKETPHRIECREKLSRMRQRTAERLKQSQNTAAMLTTFNEVDMTAVMDMREQFKSEFHSKYGAKLGFMSAFVKASAVALQESPLVNAVIDDTTREVIYRDYVDISVAIQSQRGLMVPVLRDADRMSYADIEKSIVAYGQKANEGKLSVAEMSGGTFTISNGGVYGSLLSMPIINQPQSAILGMHAIKQRAMVITTNKVSQVVSRPMMYLALSYDHRLVDGRDAVLFLKSIVNKVESPQRMLLGL